MRGLRRWAGLAVAVLAVAVLAGCWAQARFGYSFSVRSVHARGVDDAYIGFRYARHLADGLGAVYNGAPWPGPGAGPGDRVEGFTNSLYVAAVALLLRAGVQDPYHAAVGLNAAAAALLLLALVLHWQRRLDPRRALLGGALLVLCPPVYAWAASGLETVPVALLQVLCWIETERVLSGGRERRLALWGGLLALLRADGAIFPGLCAALLVWRGRRRAGLLVLAAVGLVVAGCVMARLWYYGYPLPNTYYAKVSGPVLARLWHGVRQLRYTLVAIGLLPHLLALLWDSAPVQGRRAASGTLATSAASSAGAPLTAGLLGYWILVGGDAFLDRFLLVLFPLGIAALVALLPRDFTAPGARRRVVGLAVLVILGSQLGAPLSRARMRYAADRHDAWIALGRFLRDAGHGRTLATCAAGKVPYFSQLPTLDMLGLNDGVLGHRPARFFQPGHNKFDASYVLAQRPGLIASWIDAQLDLRYGLSRALTERAGYRLRYLLYTGLYASGPDVVDVASLPDAEVRDLIQRGYTYAVLELDRQ